MFKPWFCLNICWTTFLCWSLATQACFGNAISDSIQTWGKRLSQDDDEGFVHFKNLLLQSNKLPAAEWPGVAAALKANGELANPWFASRYYIYAACAEFNQAYPSQSDAVEPLCKRALKIAYEIGDERLISALSWKFGEMMDGYNNIELAVMYCLNAAELNKKMGLPLDGGQNWKLGEVLYKIREYQKAADYCKAAIPQLGPDNIWLANCINTVALCYQKLGLYDSALLYYDSAYLYTKNFRTDIWRGIIAGNKGQVYFHKGNYLEAIPLLELDYQQSIKSGMYDNAANSLQWAAKAQLVLGNKARALEQVREAFTLLAKIPNSYYYQNLYQTAADIYRETGMPDSALYYNRKYITLHDSIERRIADSRLEISRIRLENEKNFYRTRHFQQRRQLEINTRNFIILALLLVAAIVIINMNRLRQKHLHHQQLMVEKNRIAEIEITEANKQLSMFRQHLLEKSKIIGQLQEQLQDKSLTNSQREAISSLLQSTIITEEQWSNFKSLHEKLFPGFFLRLKEKHAGITAAEQRIAALSRLKLTTKEMAAMLGISIDSASKTRQRLKHRLQLPANINVDDYLASL